MKRRIAAAAACLLLATAAAAELSHGQIAANAKTAVSKGLKDPDSAQFRGMYLTREPAQSQGKTYMVDHVCGEVNAKNGYGGYVGYRRFAVVDDLAFVDSEEPTAHASFEQAIWVPLCKNKVRDLK